MNLLRSILNFSWEQKTLSNQSWIVEYMGKPIAKLNNPKIKDTYWTDYDLVPLVQSNSELTTLYSYENWNSNSFKFISDDESKLIKKAEISGVSLNQINTFPRKIKIKLRGL